MIKSIDHASQRILVPYRRGGAAYHDDYEGPRGFSYIKYELVASIARGDDERHVYAFVPDAPEFEAAPSPEGPGSGVLDELRSRWK